MAAELNAQTDTLSVVQCARDGLALHVGHHGEEYPHKDRSPETRRQRPGLWSLQCSRIALGAVALDMQGNRRVLSQTHRHTST